MPCIAYENKAFRPESMALIEKVNTVINDYSEQGFSLTLRQVYYQMVARAIIPNNERSYKNLGNLISDARMAGLIDWEAIEDRTRNLRNNSHWNSPASIIKSAAYSYHLDHWAGQECYVEVWVEKDALIGIVGQICQQLDVPHFSCRGYVSQSEMWVAAQRMREQIKAKRDIILLHLGDHDPSGKDMSRDIEDRLAIFGCNVVFKRLALNMDQIEQYSPPPNPTKLTDSRATGYISEFGYECWELDALEPQVLSNLIERNVLEYRDDEIYQEIVEKETASKDKLTTLAKRWGTVEKNWDRLIAERPNT
jgi:hypothetical protein